MTFRRSCRTSQKTARSRRKRCFTLKPIQVCMEDLKNVGVDDKATVVRALYQVSYLLPEVSLESRLELQHVDEPTAKCPEDEITKAVDVMEQFCDKVGEAFFKELADDETFVSLPNGDGNDGTSSEQDASEWVNFVQSIRDSNEESLPKVTNRIVKLKEKYVCPVCSWKLPKRSLLFRHLQKHWDVGLQFCSDCGNLCETNSPGKSDCVECSLKERKALKEARKLEASARYRVWKPEEPVERQVRLRHKCSGCARMFATQTSAKVHEDSHRGGPCFECSPCHAAFSSKNELKMHVRVRMCHRGGSKSLQVFGCPHCDHTSAKKVDHLRHVSIHDGIRYSCRFCSQSYTQEYQVRCHESERTGKPRFRCPVCDETFVEPSTFSWHEKARNRLSTAGRTSRLFVSGPRSPILSSCMPNEMARLDDNLSVSSDDENLNPPEDSAGSVEVTLCRSVPAGKNKPPILVANSYKARPDGAGGYETHETSVVHDRQPREGGSGRLSSFNSPQPVHVEYNGLLYPAYLI